MATVRITKKLESTILHNVSSSVYKQKQNVPTPPEKLVRGAAEQFIKFHHLDNPLFNQNITSIWLKDSDSANKVADSIVISLTTPLSIALPSSRMPYPGGYDQFVLNYDDPGIDLDIATELANEFHRSVNVKEELNNFESIIKDTIARCTTLKQLIEAWEPIKEFVPQDVLDKHYQEEKTKRKKGVYLEADQLDTLNHIRLTSKITD